MPEITVFFPVYNEAGTLAELHERTSTVLKSLGRDYEILFVDDKSSDDSPAMLDALAEKDPSVRVVHHAVNRGQAGAIETGLREAAGDVVLFMDADLQVDPESIPSFLAEIDKGHDAVNGIRILRKASPFSIFASQAYNIVQCFLFDLRVNDVSSTCMAVRRPFIQNLRLTDNDHRYIVPIIASRGASISEVCVVHGKRTYGESSYSKAKIFWAAVEVFIFYWRLKKGRYAIGSNEHRAKS